MQWNTDTIKTNTDTPIELEEISRLCHKQITEIITTARRKENTRQKKNNNDTYDRNPKQFHSNLKIKAGLQTPSKALPTLNYVKDQQTGEYTNDPRAVIHTVQSFFTTELTRKTPDKILDPPWEDKNNPDNFTLQTPTVTQHPTHIPIEYSHYIRTVSRMAEGKAPGPDGISNEILRNLPDRMHSIIFELFTILYEHEYTPPAWCRSATCLIFKPSKPDPTNLDFYRPIAMMNTVLKLWTGTLHRMGSTHAEALGILRDCQDGFRHGRKIYDSLSTHIAMLEDAKINKKNIYSAYLDFRGAFNGTDHRLMFKFMRQMGMPQSYVSCCEQLYEVSKTYYVTPHGPTEDLHIERGTLQGDTLSPFLFTLFLEPLLRWLQIGSRGYQPGFATQNSTSTLLTYDSHGYADDISITTGTIEDMKVQLKKIQLFSEYKGLELQIKKCEVTGALWQKGNPTAQENLLLLQQQISTIEIIPNTKVKFLRPDETYKVLGLHLSMILNFNQHYQELTREVRAMSQILRKTKLGSHRKLRIIDSLLLAKFHTIHLGVFNPAQIKHINTIINSATRQALGYTPSLPVQAIHNVQEQYGLGRSHVQRLEQHLSVQST